MTQFRDQQFGQRFHALGDLAEQEYSNRQPHGPFVRFGWRRPTVAMTNMSPMLRYMPDFYTGDGKLVEVMGCGKDGVLKGLKVPKWAALCDWYNHVQPVQFWLWNSNLQEGFSISLIQMTVFVLDSVEQFGVQKFEVDGNEYYPIPWAWIQREGW
jgi:hypothetical protein